MLRANISLLENGYSAKSQFGPHRYISAIIACWAQKLICLKWLLCKYPIRSSQISLFLCDYFSAKINLLENGYSAKSQFGARPLPLAPALKPFSFDPLRNIGLFKSNMSWTSIWGKPAALSKLFQPDLESSWGHANIGPAFILPSLMMRVNPVIWALKQTSEVKTCRTYLAYGAHDEGSHNKIHATSIAQISIALNTK